MGRLRCGWGPRSGESRWMVGVGALHCTLLKGFGAQGGPLDAETHSNCTVVVLSIQAAILTSAFLTLRDEVVMTSVGDITGIYSLTDKGVSFLYYIFKNHVKKTDYRTNLFIFEGSLKESVDGCISHDFTRDSRGWISGKTVNFKDVFAQFKDNCVVIIDSLVHMLYRYGPAQIFNILNELKTNANVLQVVALLHSDLLEDNDVTAFIKHIATLHIELDSDRVLYTYKKSIRKIIKELEEFHFVGEVLVTQPIKKPDAEKIRDVIPEVNPENLSTFKIGLTDRDKESRDNLVLPYLPKDGEGEIHYTFDNVDDWDEEDPDDDLDI